MAFRDRSNPQRFFSKIIRDSRFLGFFRFRSLGVDWMEFLCFLTFEVMVSQRFWLGFSSPKLGGNGIQFDEHNFFKRVETTTTTAYFFLVREIFLYWIILIHHFLVFLGILEPRKFPLPSIGPGSWSSTGVLTGQGRRGCGTGWLHRVLPTAVVLKHDPICMYIYI